MSNSQELAKANPSELAAGVTLKGDYQSTPVGIIPRTVDECLTVAKAFAASGFFKDAQNASQAVAKIMYGAELGLTPAASMQGIYFFESKMTIGGTLLGALIRKSGRYKYKVHETTTERCSIEFLEKEDKEWVSIGISNFSMEDATRANLAGKNIWKQYPQTMLYNRALSAGVKVYIPDLFGGMVVYTEGELEEVKEEVSAIEETMRDPNISQSEKIRLKIEGTGTEPELTKEAEEMGVTPSDPTSITLPVEEAAPLNRVEVTENNMTTGPASKHPGYDPEADDTPPGAAAQTGEAETPKEEPEPEPEAPKEETTPPVKVKASDSSLVLGQPKTIEIADRLLAINSEMTAAAFIAQCKAAGMTTADQVEAKLAEIEGGRLL